MLSSTVNHAFLLVVGGAALAQAHFVLQVPPSLGHESASEPKGPCGGFEISTRTPVTDFPVGGSPVGFLNTHNTAIFEFKAALLKDLSTWRYLTLALNLTGLGSFCEPSIPGVKEWAGQDAVLQVVQLDDHHGNLYQVSEVALESTGWASEL